MIDLDNQTSLEFALKPLEDIASHLNANATIELLIVNNHEIQTLNKQHRNITSATDVLSFPLDNTYISKDVIEFPLGSIVISETYVRQKATYYGHSFQDELSLLFIHGMLHLLGFDHDNDLGQMRLKEEETIKHFNLPKSLIIRTEA